MPRAAETLDWDDVQLFLAAWHAGTLTGAAAALGVAQATVSRRMAQFEQQLGHVLFERARGGLVPTPSARALKPHAEAMAAAARDARAALHGVAEEPAGRVRIAVPPGAAVDLATDLVPMVAARAPKVVLSILADTHVRSMERHEADIALRSFAEDSPDVACRALSSVHMGIFASAGLAATLPVNPDPTRLPWLQWSEDLAHIPPARFVSGHLGKRSPALISNNFLVLRAAAMAGIGCMVMPCFQGQRAGLTRLPIPCLPPAPLWMVLPRSLRRLPRVRVVVDCILELLETVAAAD